MVPRQVCHAATREDREEHPLGSITRISAGANSSVAASLHSEIWQWGEISSEFREQQRDAKRPGRERAAPTGAIAQTNRPFRAFGRESYRTRMRRTRVSLSETGCKVRPEGTDVDLDRLKDLVESVRQLQVSIEARRTELARIEAEKQKSEKKKQGESGRGAEVMDVSDTLAVLEREISAAEHDIYLYEKNLESCDLQQAHHRDQLQRLSEQAIELGEEEDETSLALVEAKRGSAEWKALQEKLAKVKEYILANQSSRMALLDQRGQTDQEKQRIARTLDEKIRLKGQLQNRYRTVKDLSEATIRARATSDVLLNFLTEQKKEFFEYFEGKRPEQEFTMSMQELENDNIFLQRLEAKTKAFTAAVINETGESNHESRAAHIRDILQDLLDVHRSWSSLLADRWVKDDLDLACFFSRAAKPKQTRTAVAAGGSPAPALAWGGALALQDGAA